MNKKKMHRKLDIIKAKQEERERINKSLKKLKEDLKSHDCAKFYDIGEHISYIEIEEIFKQNLGELE